MNLKTSWDTAAEYYFPQNYADLRRKSAE